MRNTQNSDTSSSFQHNEEPRKNHHPVIGHGEGIDARFQQVLEAIMDKFQTTLEGNLRLIAAKLDSFPDQNMNKFAELIDNLNNARYLGQSSRGNNGLVANNIPRSMKYPLGSF